MKKAFLLSKSDDRRHPHSFPTRRSSDLHPVGREHRRRRPCRGGLLRPQRQLGGLGEDRKSTRLNSSHSSISYAVFCLKKKNPAPDHYNMLRRVLIRLHCICAHPLIVTTP